MMSHALRLAMVATLVFTLTGFGQAALAETIVSHTSPAQTIPVFGGNIGQSFTTPDTDQGWNNLRFNWFDDQDQGAATSPSASGTLFLLSQAYSGQPGDLSSATPGYIAQSISIDNGQFYVFDTTVELNLNTQYFVYTNGFNSLQVAADSSQSYTGGVGYTAGGFGPDDFIVATDDFNFEMTGVAIPEPGTLVLLGLAGLTLLRRTRTSQV